MKYLGLTGVDLARMVTALRDDGKSTAPETISRWATGVNPVDPCLVGWLQEMVRAKILRDRSGSLEGRAALKALLAQIIAEIDDGPEDQIEQMDFAELLNHAKV
jgi:hypothetical protein